LKKLLGGAFVNILSDEAPAGYAHGMITENFLKEHIAGFDKIFYICGPPPMVDAVQKYLTHLGAGDNSVVVEI
ncbi:MAG TPA: flavodoxin reductase, partial [Chitinophagaceae bacterium]